MKVYVRRWTGSTYAQEGPWTIDAYNGLNFVSTTANAEVMPAVEGRVRNIFLHVSEPDTLVVYVGKGG